MTTPVLSVIIVNWNTGTLLHDCLASIADGTSSQTHEIIVVDNASTDGSVDLVRQFHPYVRLIEARENRGYAGGNNLALPLARGEFIVLLNPDTLVVDGALERLTRFLTDHPRAGAVGPQLIHPGRRYKIRNGGWQPSIATILAHYSGLSRLFPGRVRGLHTIANQQQPVGWLSGACLVARRAAIEAAGPLHEGWFLYAEDVEWCHRIRNAGWQLWFEPNARIIHFDRASTSQRERAYSTMWAHGLHHCYARNTGAPWLRLFLFDIALAAGLVSRALLYTLRFASSPRAGRHWHYEACSFIRAAREVLQLGWQARSEVRRSDRSESAA